MKLKLRMFRDKILSEVATDISEGEFGKELDETMSSMAMLMYSSQGVGLAGPQVGISKRILVADMSAVVGDVYGRDLVKMVNPVVQSFSEEVASAEEGCLSFPGLGKKVERALAVHVKFFSPLTGQEESRTFSGWKARIILHEIDHLDGVTLYSRLTNYGRRRYDCQRNKG